MTVAQAAEALGMSPRGIRERIDRGEIQAIRVNRRLLMIPLAEVDRWRGRGRLKPGPKPRQGRIRSPEAGDEPTRASEGKHEV